MTKRNLIGKVTLDSHVHHNYCYGSNTFSLFSHYQFGEEVVWRHPIQVFMNYEWGNSSLKERTIRSRHDQLTQKICPLLVHFKLLDWRHNCRKLFDPCKISFWIVQNLVLKQNSPREKSLMSFYIVHYFMYILLRCTNVYGSFLFSQWNVHAITSQNQRQNITLLPLESCRTQLLIMKLSRKCH